MLPCLVLAAGLFAGTALAADPITLTIDATQTGYAIPSNYVGLSFSRDSISGANSYEQLFNPSKDTYYSHLTNLLAQIGVKHLRTISGTASTSDPDPTGAQDDLFFSFAQASGVTSIIYSLHLFNEEGTDDVAAAYHIWTTPADKALLESFALDNESDWKYHYRSPYPDPVITGYATPTGYGYKDKWALLYTNIQNYLGNPSPAAPFSGPDTGSNYPIQTDSSSDTSIPYPGGVPFTLRCAIDQAPRLKTATQHYYYGNPGTSMVQTATIALDPARLTEWNTLYANSLAGASGWPSGLPFRLTESSPFLNDSGNTNQQIFATALWGLDYFCWWAGHGCAGIDPFTRVVQYNSPIFQLPNNDFVAAPYAYGMKAFSLASQGTTITAAGIQLSNPNHINWTPYGVVGANDLYVTLINKTFNPVGSYDAVVTINKPTGFAPTSAKYIVLTSGADGSATATSATLGGATIPTAGSWNGTWNSLAVTNGACSLTVQAASAVVVDLQQDTTPTISVARSGNKVVITYVGTLLSSTNVTGTYTPVTGASSPYTIPTINVQQFYRAIEN